MTGGPEPEKRRILLRTSAVSVTGLVEHQFITLDLIVGSVNRRGLTGHINKAAAHVNRNLDHRGKVGNIKVAHDLVVFPESLIS